MIDNKMLEGWLKDLESGSANKRYQADGFIYVNKHEILELSLLGLWARDVGVPAFKQANECLTVPAAEYVPSITDAWKILDKALAALPKDIQK